MSNLDVLAAIVRGEAPTAPDEAACTALLEAASVQGIKPLITARLADTEYDGWPAAAVAEMKRQASLGTALEALRQRELAGVLAALESRGVRTLLLKGSGLAYTLYHDPALRPRFDTDVLVRREDIGAVTEVMERSGYRRPAQVTGELVMHQLDYARRDQQGVWHVYDFHWKLTNRQVVADVLSYDELFRDSVKIPALGSNAFGPSRVHALILACVHRVAHHPADERLIWVYDIHLLAEALTPEEAQSFTTLAIDRTVAAICADGLEAARRWFHTRLPGGVLERLAAQARPEPSASLLGSTANRIDELFSDLRALPAWTHRARLVYEHAFPPASYMTGTYNVTSRAWLPALYTHRLVRGAWRWLAGRGSRRSRGAADYADRKEAADYADHADRKGAADHADGADQRQLRG